MEETHRISSDSGSYPFLLFQFPVRKDQISDKQKDKWKKKSCKKELRSLLCHLFLLLPQLLLFLAHPVSGDSRDGIIVTQADYQALQAIKREFSDPKGVLRSWNDSGIGACSGGWVGIKCVQGQVIAIQLPWKGLGGRISEKIGQLSSLRKLSVHDNFIGGPVPLSFGFIPNLRGVYLFNNRLSGSIPPSIGNCHMLQNLDLSNNLLTGIIPNSLSNCTRLYRLNMSFNGLTGSVPIGLTRLRSLTFLSLQHNNLSGSIPDTWGGIEHHLYQLQTLSLDHNSLTGRIPASLGVLVKVEEINLSNNQIQGSIPQELQSLSMLQTLDLSENAISGSLPTGLFKLSSLIRLNLGSNLLDNKIPEAVDGLKNISVLILRRNQLEGQIPASIGNISGLSQLDLSENKLTGEIPSSLSDPPYLDSFNVSYNNLMGPVPLLLSKKFNSTSFLGNLQLCGYSVSSPCPSSPPPSSQIIIPPPVSHRHNLSTKEIILVAAGALMVLLLLLCCIWLCCFLRKRTGGSDEKRRSPVRRGEKAVPPIGSELESGGEAGGKLVHFDGPLVFTADDLLCATAEIMGKSTYGTVYKATLEDGSQVAVKRLREKIAKSQKDFEAEVNLLGKIRHPNLLALRAYYLGPKGEKLLVFDFMPKGSLASFLHAHGPDAPINWPTRMNIAIGTTRGLCYLHTQENIVHGNLTSSNILLDEQADAKIADFGLSRLMTPAANSNVVATAGALGYRAPELSKLKKPTAKTDVYSLGVIILELLTGKSPGESMSGVGGVDLPQWVASIVKEEWTNEVFDLELMRHAASSDTGDELLNTLKLALHCVDPAPAARPEIQQVLKQLEEIKPVFPAGPGADDAAITGIPSASE